MPKKQPKQPDRSAIIDANREVHSRLADVYDTTEPHFRPENQAKVKERLAAVQKRTGGGKLLDVGCGTGFILRLAYELFDELRGVDVTPEMMKRIPNLGPKLHVQLCEAEKLPFADGTFDAASAYSVLDHLSDYAVTLKEVARVLKPGGIFYVDLVPNRSFWGALSKLPDTGYSDIVTRERKMVIENDKRIEQEYQISADVFRAAEPGKLEGGMDAAEVAATAKRVGFSKCEVVFDWFLGQGNVMHGESFEAAATVQKYLHRVDPLANHLFKYLCFYMVK